MIGKYIIKTFLAILALPLAYLFIGLVTSYITVNQDFEQDLESEYIVYLHTNGVHLDIAFNKDHIATDAIQGLYTAPENRYISFGWGEENFYLNTREWKDLTVKNAIQAMFMESLSLMHITRYNDVQSDWIQIHLNKEQHHKLLNEIVSTFQTDSKKQVIILKDASYTSTDEFYRAIGSYHIFNTCNTWVNTAFKNSGLKACLWTPFDFALIDLYKH
ncbi:MAG: DUF2459 domain-containing protein [Weeksellaceae bacterium]